MRYREAKDLHNGDQVIRKEDKAVLTVQDIEVYGQYKKVRLNCLESGGSRVSLYHDEIE